jgi:hypothetical protein
MFYLSCSRGRPWLTNVRTYEQAADLHSPRPANICSLYEHWYAPVESQVSSTEQATFERKFGKKPICVSLTL